ncbi:Prolow-density lipoprotein receptor-related protein 1 [Eumeta japonica]|uniref:Prolow-density lipoprotein receptor-related protein 1 n=1 Tax=Eumeta variegata TaxID=151549 RepID=A0A4C2AER3_EUMVA|nr:Prolow-density lipoprotein receptor-related protein 1 [Eumeta japonica]
MKLCRCEVRHESRNGVKCERGGEEGANSTVACAEVVCEEGCRNTHDGPARYCRAGYEPRAGWCRDSDECVTEDTCEQRCRNTIGSFQCSCVEGYELRADRTSCKAINGDPLFPTP